MNWEFVSDVNVQLTETELRYYNDILLYCCDSSDSDQVAVLKAADLFRSANLPRDVTLKILETCSGPNSHMSRKQFYCALKLVAAHQAGFDVSRDLTINTLNMATPLPRFSWPTTGDEETMITSRLPDSTTESESDAESPRETGGSTDSPTPTNSVTQERIDGLLGSETILDSASGSWQGLLVSEEQRQLLGTEEESSERHSSDENDGETSNFPPEEVWIISDEQRDYYTAQFSRLQPDPDGLLAGHVARTFFEKSRLPVAELRRIWQLADVTRDGALSLAEFYVAMHLVVLRRNHVPLPDALPPNLAINLGPLGNLIAPPPPPPPPPPPSPPNKSKVEVSAGKNQEKSKEWTKFVDSPTGGGAVTSPGPKPVNFDFQKSAVERDPKILHPVPLRLTPEAAILASGVNGNNGVTDEDVLSVVQRAKKVEDSLIVTPKKEPPPPPPPRPYRTHTRSSSLDLNKLGKNGQNFLGAPPSVPPRVSPGISSPRKLVGQRSECDNHRIASENQSSSFVADFSHFSPKAEENTGNVDSASTSQQNQQFAGHSGAFHIYRKPSPKKGEGEEETSKDDIDSSRQLTLEELRERNAELRLVCEELTRELAGALQERINLRAKLLLIT